MDEKGKMNTEKYEELIKEVEANSPYKRLSSAKKKWMSVSEMGELLGLKKTDRYWLVHKNFFETKEIAGKMRVNIESFEKWYANQIKYHKVNGEEPGKELKEWSYSVPELAEMLELTDISATLDALCLAAKRGVDVRIITPGIPDKKFIYNITRSFYHGLVKHGVRVYEWTPGFCHAKMSVVDDCMATCGTINLDYRSLYHHFENGCFMIDCQSVLDIKSGLIKTMGECRDVTEQYCTGRSAYLRLGQLFMRLFAGLL